jgi:hypothetical protein
LSASPDKLGVVPTRISFVAALCDFVEFCCWVQSLSRVHSAKQLAKVEDRVRPFVSPPRPRSGSFPRAVEIQMGNYARDGARLLGKGR